MIVFIIVIAASVFAIYQKNNIQSLLYSSKYSGDELEERNQDINSKIKTVVEQVLGISIVPLSEEDSQKLINGEISREEAFAIITGNSKSGSDSVKINELVVDVYLLKADYLSRIYGLITQIESEWNAVPYEERTLTKKFAVIRKYMDKGSKLERECDKKMDALLKELEKELKASGKDTSIISEITALYNEEKAVKKAALLGKYYP
ncbi:MAG: hypothetical protein IJQ50_06870 [Clostridia bacterium]|nr:hypothetical protein [Clostridia bacterium]